MHKTFIGLSIITLSLLLGYQDRPIGMQETVSTPKERGTIFIAPNGTGTDCTLEAPCNIEVLDHFHKKIQIKAGEVVFFRGGVYHYSMNTIKRIYLQGGTKKQPVIYESFPEELAIFDGSLLDIHNQDKKEWREGRLELRGNHIHLRKIAVRALPQYGIRILGNHNVVEGCMVYNNHLSGIEILNGKDGYSDKPTGGSYNLVSNNMVYNNSDEHLAYGNYNLGGNADGITVHSGLHNVISHNTVFENSDDGIDTYKSIHTRVNHNLVYAHGKGEGNANGIKLGGVDNKLGINIEARHNIVYQNNGFGITVHGKENNVSIEYNTAYDNKKSAFAILDDTTLNYNIAFENQKGDVAWSKGKEQKHNSWQNKNQPIHFINFNQHFPNFLKPTLKSKVKYIGAYAKDKQK